MAIFFSFMKSGSPVTTVRNPAFWCSKNAPFENVPRETFTNGFGLDDIVSRGTYLVEETSKRLKKRKIALFLLGICQVRELCLVENRNHANFSRVFLEFRVP
jgi:hypothetical protein